MVITEGCPREEKTSVVIIGAGVSGICMAIDLIRRVGTRDFIIIEKDEGFGGTWRRNRYPGCCSDAQSFLYCFSFAPNYTCKRTHPSRSELELYLNDVARHWQLEKHVRFQSTVKRALWEDDQKWSIVVKESQDLKAADVNEYSITSSYLITATGQLHTPYVPNIQGLTRFKGKVMHTADWDEDENLEGKNVGIIGNGASCLQVVPEILACAKNVTVFQRSPSWIIPRGEVELSWLQKFLYRWVPIARSYFRARILRKQDEIHAMIINPEARQSGMELCEQYLKYCIPKNSSLRARLTSHYPMGCKRVLLSDKFYSAMTQPSARLETGAITHMTETSVQAGDVEVPLDVLILATGFRSQRFLEGVEIIGKHGRTISDSWKHCARAHRGITVEDMPNFSMLYGPNTNLSHVSVILVIEAQARYISAMVGFVQRRNKEGFQAVICPKSQAIEDYNDVLQAWLRKTVFASSECTSWYKTGDGVVVNNWPGTAFQYQSALSMLNWDEYDVAGCNDGANLPKKFQDLGGPLENLTSPTLAALMWFADRIVSILRRCGDMYKAAKHRKDVTDSIEDTSRRL